MSEQTELTLDEFKTSFDDLPEDTFKAKVTRVFPDIFEGEYGKAKQICIELDSPMSTPEKPHIERYTYQKMGDDGNWKPPHRKGKAGILLESLKATKIAIPGKTDEFQAKKGVELKEGWGDLEGEEFDWVRKEIPMDDGGSYTVTIPIVWYPTQ
jgi:hypothetical protein